MPRITYIEHDGTRHDVEATAGQSLMQTAIDNLIPGILGDCGGVCSCATCHVYVNQAWDDALPPMSESEEFLLEGVPDRQPENSRLSCQLTVDESMDGMEVRLPEEQY
ncbi:2Fe-2S iron-sulfur cluster-binding protein [Alloalcanivorax mobilis]|uniref:2Fe-2S iron-sulfur cluster-binding protein n=1 Tax=Alloalcanivorax mobilis TaxID=2019569 RepID=UPI000C779CE7|nr:2Fe-2S iron-sulfur cluster-binding protein [Alloalcanivorax mobilis]|tara:strand:+ start:35327 stop:35650 length:324 start_codon:yes stop_codon:yes gene_type:complete